jgi:hypothetical protein
MRREAVRWLDTACRISCVVFLLAVRHRMLVYPVQILAGVSVHLLFSADGGYYIEK